MGILFTLAYALAVTGIVAVLGLTELTSLPAGWQLTLPFVALETFGYGLFGSVMGRSVLEAVDWGLLPVAMSWILGGESRPGRRPVWLIGVRTTLLLAVLVLTGLIFCRRDMQRGFGRIADFTVRRSVSRRKSAGSRRRSTFVSPATA